MPWARMRNGLLAEPVQRAYMISSNRELAAPALLHRFLERREFVPAIPRRAT
jgi:hypothetical protein